MRTSNEKTLHDERAVLSLTKIALVCRVRSQALIIDFRHGCNTKNVYFSDLYDWETFIIQHIYFLAKLQTE